MPRRRKIRPDDIFQIQLPESPAISADGERVVYSLRRLDRKQNRYFANLWLVPARGGRARQLTRGDQLDLAPAWRPDGKEIAFLSTREKKTQVWVIPADGGEARQLTELEGSFSELRYSPDGKSLLFLHRHKQREKPEDRAKRATYKHITRLLHKYDGFGYFDENRQQLWVANARTGSAKQLTQGDCDVSGPRWSPDGKQIAYMANPEPELQHEGHRTQLFVVSAKSGRPRQVTTRTGYRGFMDWAPEGNSLLFAGHWGGPGEWITYPYQLMEVSLRGERYTELTPWMDDWPFNFVLSDTVMGEAAGIHPYREDGAWRLAFVQGEQGCCRVYSMPREGCRRKADARLELDGPVNTYHLSVTADGRAAAAVARMMDCGDIHACDLDGGKEAKRLTNVNRAIFNRLQLTEPEEHWFKSGSRKVHGWILKPPGLRKGRKAPGVLNIHGGPMGQYGNVFFHEMHLLAAQGYVVAFSNPRGSCGYGNRWMNTIEGRWGTVDYDDLMAVAGALARKPEVDARRLAVLGGSYGGFMTTEILGRTPRFKTGITMRQAGNRLIQFGAADYNINSGHYFKAMPWDKPLKYLRHSPNYRADRIKAPLLIIHSEEDLRCPIAQADELFVFLKAQGRTCEYIRFEGESHGLSRGGKPLNRLERLNRIVDWFERYLV